MTSSPVRVSVGGDVTLTCTVTRSNPTGFTYTWTNVNTTTTLPGETAATLTLTSITMDEIATYSCEVTNSGGARGTGTLTLQQGCEYKYRRLSEHRYYTRERDWKPPV